MKSRLSLFYEKQDYLDVMRKSALGRVNTIGAAPLCFTFQIKYANFAFEKRVGDVLSRSGQYTSIVLNMLAVF